jgi:hypothetical protein
LKLWLRAENLLYCLSEREWGHVGSFGFDGIGGTSYPPISCVKLYQADEKTNSGIFFCFFDQLINCLKQQTVTRTIAGRSAPKHAHDHRPVQNAGFLAIWTIWTIRTMDLLRGLSFLLLFTSEWFEAQSQDLLVHFGVILDHNAFFGDCTQRVQIPFSPVGLTSQSPRQPNP